MNLPRQLSSLADKLSDAAELVEPGLADALTEIETELRRIARELDTEAGDSQ